MKQIKKIFVLILFISFFFPAAMTEAADGETYEVSPAVLHVRDEPAKTSSIIGMLQQGDKVTAFSEQYGWVQTYYAGELAWVAKHHLIPTNSVTQSESVTENKSPETTTSTSNTVEITVSSVVIRSGPGQVHGAIGGASLGESYTVLDQSGEWLNIDLYNGKTGWIASWLTSHNGENTSNSSSDPSPSTENSAQTASQTVNTPSTPSLEGYNIVIDAGHGGRDPGAIGLDGVLEKDIVTPTATTIANTLRSYGATVVETRTGDYYLPLDQRAQISNNHYTDAFLSIHYDAFPVMAVQGVSTYYASNNSKNLAQNIQQSIASAVELDNRGIKQEKYRVLRNTNAPAVLLELGFITNPHDISVVQTSDYQNRVAEAIASGLTQYFNK